MTVRKRGGRWHFDFQIKGVRYREAIPEARTKYQAEQAETKARDEVYQGIHGTPQLGTQEFCQFVSETYLPWAKGNKCTWRNDEIIANEWVEGFRGKTLREVHAWRLKNGNVIALSPSLGAAQLAVPHR